MEIQKIAIEKIKHTGYNPRQDLKPGDPLYEKLKRSIEEYGYVEPIVLNKRTGNIVGGHQRAKVLAQLGVREIDCVMVDLDEQGEKALNVALNKVTGEWDDEKLANLLSDLTASNFDISLTGFDSAEIDALLTKVSDTESHEDSFDIDKELENGEPPFVHPGDIWLLGRHRLMCGDSTKAEDVATLMDGKQANLCVTDPPYNCDISGGTGMKIMNDNMSDAAFKEFLLKAFTNIYNSLADGGAFYCFHSDAEKVNFYNATVEAGFHYSTTCVWVKNSLVIGRMDYQMRHEPILYGFKDTAKHRWYSDRKQTTVWEYDRPTRSKLHPTMKSIELLSYPIRNSSQVNGIVLDSFGGSGSTMIACEQLDRICFMMELDPKYASVIVKRAIGQFGNSDGVCVLREGISHPYADAVVKA